MCSPVCSLPFYYGEQLTVELQWLEPHWKHENMFETGVVRANEC